MDSGIDHRVASNLDEERGRRVLDEMFIQVEILVDEVVGGGGKTGGDGRDKEREFPRLWLLFESENFTDGGF